MAQIDAAAFDEIMVSLSGGHVEAPQGMDGELHRLMPGISASQRMQLFAWVLYCVNTLDTEDERERLLLAFVVGLGIGQRVGRAEGG